MAQLFTSPDATDYDAIKVSDIEPLSLATADQEIVDFIRNNGATAPKNQPSRSPNKRERILRALDQYYGPLIVGQFTVSRIELHLMNATVHGEPLDIGNTNFRRTPQAFIDGLQLNPADVENRIRASGTVGDYTIPTLLFEIATHRSVDASPLFSEAQGTHAQKIDRLLQSAQKLDIRDTRLPENVPGWVNKQKSKVVNGMGVGLQAFGIYSGLMGISDSIKSGDRTEAAINAGAVVTELGSLIIERGLVKTAQELIENSALVYQGFARTHFGLHLSRAAGLIAGALTLPFDIYFAIKALNDASKTTGKQALDHYVAAGMNLSSAALTLILGTAALAGFAYAGPLGIAAAAILITGSQIYSAVRYVDDIDDYIELSVDERLVTGFLAFLNQSPPQRIEDRYSVALTKDQHSKMVTRRARRWLDGQMKDRVEAIVNGKVHVSLKAEQVFWFEEDAQGREYMGSKEIKAPQVQDENDTIDARNGIPSDLPGVVKGTDGETKATLWLLGGGKDTVIGVENKPNHFSYGTGSKHLTGGEKDDHFLFEGAVETLKAPAPAQTDARLLGGDGNDTLVFQGNLESRDVSPHTGYEIDLENGRIRLLSPIDSTGPALLTTLDSIENVETLVGARNVVKGSASANLIVSRGHDQIDAGEGDDTIYLMGSHGSAAGGAGRDQYFIAHTSGTVTISEDAQQESVIVMDWSFESIQKWSIEDTSLVVSSLCGKDGELPPRTLIIKDVYKKVADKRLFQEQTLRFLTQDGFHLTPDFPDELEGVDNHSVEILILTPGKRPMPMIINHRAHRMSDVKTSHYFIDRNFDVRSFSIPKTNFNSSNTLSIDCDSTEITEVRATYSVQVENRNANYYLTYSNVDLELRLGIKKIRLRDITNTPSDEYFNIRDTPYMVNALVLNQEINLTMRDGVSYKIRTPSPNYVNDVKNPGLKELDGWQMLQKRSGNYLLNTPNDSKPRLLDPRPQRIDFPVHLQNAVASLEGSGSTYYVYFSDNTTLRISTPGALAKTSNASTWYFHSRDEHSGSIRLSGNKLLAGRGLIILLPDYKDENIPIEELYVITPSGITYAVDLLFEQVYIHSEK
ncbi:calcium-binding protein [Pseudomonas izuensis]|uniref:calcium-binding protein n=1 Tax=Pseudomonas izuensis TaxID=2684212 RepID=UPI001358601B|nr:calcium-binding protein [Pseudomonas izuensis]